MKLSIQRNIKGKPTKEFGCGNKPYYVCDGYRVNLGYNWLNIECDWETAFELITTDGLATSAELLNDNRTDENYVSRQLVMVDIDDGMTIPELFKDQFYNEYGAGFYATASHTEEHHRFRIMFVLEEPITDREQMKKIMRGLLIVYQSGDTVCKDASRLYYGVPHCKLKERTDKVLPKVITDGLIEMVKELEAKEEEQLKTKYVPDSNKEVDYEFVNELLRRISYKVGDLNGDYEQWRPIAWATCHAVGIGNAQSLMMTYWPTKTKKHIQTLKSWKQHHDGPTVGTLIKLSGISSTERQLLELQMRMRKMK
jgi:hypothetical protein